MRNCPAEKAKKEKLKMYNKNMKTKIFFTFLLFLTSKHYSQADTLTLPNTTVAEERVLLDTNVQKNAVLSFEDAVKIALERNFNVKIEKGKQKQAQNNKSVLNSDYLPTLGVNAETYTANTQGYRVSGGEKSTYQNSKSTVIGTSGELGFVLFNGLSRLFNYQKLINDYKISQLDFRLALEQIILQLADSYYQYVFLSQQEDALYESVKLSRERYERMKMRTRYGQNTSIDLLTAEVDYSKDSIKWLENQAELIKARNQINVMLARSGEIRFSGDTAVAFKTRYVLDSLLEKARKQNAEWQAKQRRVQSEQLLFRSTIGSWMPTVNLYARYSLNMNKTPYDFTSEQESQGYRLGASASWRLFDGGKTAVRNQNQRIAMENAEFEKERVALKLDSDVRLAYMVFENALAIFYAEQKNLERTQKTLKRALELYNSGQITSLDYRQAQLNYINGQITYYKVLTDLKKSELKLQQLSGELVQMFE
jgi:outer membrane protein TolC